MESNLDEHQDDSGSRPSSSRLGVLFLGSEWGSSKGGLSTINRELAINVAKHPEADVTFFVPRCDERDKEAALGHNIKLVEATELIGMEELQWLCCPPSDLHIDVVVGHGIPLGPQANLISKIFKCKWVQVVHTIPEELGMYKAYLNPISNAQEKHKTELQLCKEADFVVSIGPKLNEAFHSYLASCNKGEMFLNFTPGILSEFSEIVHDSKRPTTKFRVLLLSRGDVEDFSVKGLDIAAKAVAALSDLNVSLVFVGAKTEELEKVTERFLQCGIQEKYLTVRGFVENREELKQLFSEMDLAIMPSRTEGFGLSGLEALSAGLPTLVSGNSGFGDALREVFFGSHYVVDSDKDQDWSIAIKKLRNKQKSKRLEESKLLRSLYASTYSSEEQCKELILKMTTVVQAERTQVLRGADLVRPLRVTQESEENLQKQLREMQQREENSQKQLVEMQQREENSQKQLKEMQQHQENSQRELAEMQQREENSQKQLKEMQQREENSQKQLAKMQQREENSQRQLAEMKEREENSERQLRETQQLEVYLQRQLSDIQEREETGQRKIRDLQECEEESQRQLRQMRQREETSERQLREMQEQFEIFQGQVSTVERQLKERDQEVTELVLSLSVAQQTISEQQQQGTCDWVISRDEIQMTNKCLGRGGWGIVYEGVYCGCTVAVKQIHELIVSPHNIRLFEREMNIASKCRHPNLLQFVGATMDDGSPLFVTEKMEKSLRTLLEQRQLFETEITIISLDVARALCYLHQRKPVPIIHRDVSSANVLLWKQGDQWRGKVSDYGTVNFIQQTMTVAPGAMVYSAPEALTSNQTVKVDVYSFGVLLCEMCIRQFPDPRRREQQVLLMTNRALRGLVRRCLQTDPEARPTMQEIIDELSGAV